MKTKLEQKYCSVFSHSMEQIESLQNRNINNGDGQTGSTSIMILLQIWLSSLVNVFLRLLLHLPVLQSQTSNLITRLLLLNQQKNSHGLFNK